MNETNKETRLTESGLVILIFSIVISVIFIIIGIVNLALNPTDDGYSGSGNGDSGSYWAYEDLEKEISVTRGKYYDIKFTPDYYGVYTIKLDGAYITRFTNAAGHTVSYDSIVDYYYDYAYNASLNPSYTYTIRIYATENTVRFLAQ